MRQILYVIIIALILPLGVNAGNIKRSNIKVLVVAHNPNKEFSKRSGQRNASRKDENRGEDYKNLLDKYFDKVVVVYSEDYTPAMSDKYDVTIMDELPNALETVDFGLYRSGKSIMRGTKPLMFDKYLPDDFAGAVIVMGRITDDLTYIYPSKIITQ